MEREILFRGKDNNIEGVGWVYGYYVKEKSPIGGGFNHLIYSGDITYDWSKESYFPTVPVLNHVDPDTVGQYTGFVDMAGEKVFEGDFCVVKKPGMLACGFITFHQGCFWFEEKNTGNLLRLCDIEINGYQIEVRGNIHNNPELLEVQG